MNSWSWPCPPPPSSFKNCNFQAADVREKCCPKTPKWDTRLPQKAQPDGSQHSAIHGSQHSPAFLQPEVASWQEANTQILPSWKNATTFAKTMCSIFWTRKMFVHVQGTKSILAIKENPFFGWLVPMFTWTKQAKSPEQDHKAWMSLHVLKFLHASQCHFESSFTTAVKMIKKNPCFWLWLGPNADWKQFVCSNVDPKSGFH